MKMGKHNITAQTIGKMAIAVALSMAAPMVADAGEVVYTSTAYGPAIHSYQTSKNAERSAESPTITYVSMAYGPAIYSYPRASQDTVTAFNVKYTNSAYGPAIYSYPYAGMNKPSTHWLRLVPAALHFPPRVHS